MTDLKQAAQAAHDLLADLPIPDGYYSASNEVIRLLDAALALPAPDAQAQRDREADRARFTDSGFNRWLDEGISDAGHTVWDAVGDVQAAWSGWQNREFYVAPPQRPLTDEQIDAAVHMTGPALLELAKQWSDNKIHVYQFTAAAEVIVRKAVERGTGGAQ